jgi:hypothetical protein
MNNLEVYNKYRQVPAEALKPFDNGNFKGTVINSMWRVKCLTEQFGVVGHGWTVRVLRTWIEKCEYTNEVYAFAEIEMQVKIGDDWGKPFTATGGNKFCSYVKSKDYYKGSDEAFKMAITDAFGVCCKYLGIGADVYFANDKSKYTKNNKDNDSSPENSPKKPVIKKDNKEDEPKEMTLEEAENLSATMKSGVERKFKELTDEQLNAIKVGSVNKTWLKAVELILESRKNEKENLNND